MDGSGRMRICMKKDASKMHLISMEKTSLKRV
jgi:hypothetical protein